MAAARKNPAAVELGRRGGRAGRGAAKSRGPGHFDPRAAAVGRALGPLVRMVRAGGAQDRIAQAVARARAAGATDAQVAAALARRA